MSSRYFFKFRVTDTGLTPTFVFYKNAATLANITPPAVSELAGGVYYFDPGITDPEVVFQIDGTAAVPNDQRYISSSITPRESDVLSRAVGLLHENSVMDQTSFSGGKLTAARVRLYDSAANATAATNTGKLFEYHIAATYSGGNLTSYIVTKS